jgi:hypothetical protein
LKEELEDIKEKEVKKITRTYHSRSNLERFELHFYERR